MNWKDIQGLVTEPGRSPDFDDCLEAFPQLRLAVNADKSAPHHKEGTVGVHTQMCIEELLTLDAYRQLPRANQEIAFLGVLLHDLAKCSTTVVDPETGQISHPGHSRKGAIDALVAYGARTSRSNSGRQSAVWFSHISYPCGRWSGRGPARALNTWCVGCLAR
jgi:hypothetical protein